MRQGGLAYAGHVLQQQVAAGDQAGEGQFDLVRLAQQDTVDLVDRGLQALLQGFGAGLDGGGHDFSTV